MLVVTCRKKMYLNGLVRDSISVLLSIEMQVVAFYLLCKKKVVSVHP